MQVGYVAQQVAKRRSKRGYDPPTDPKFSQEWYLVSAGGSGEGRVELWYRRKGRGGKGVGRQVIFSSELFFWLCRKTKEVGLQQRALT